MTETIHTQTTTTSTKEKTKEKNWWKDILSILGFAILFIIIIWGILHLASLLSPWFSSLYTKPVATLRVSAPSQATSTYPVQVSWSYSPSTSGTYAFLYACKDGVSFAVPSATASTTFNEIPCGVAYTTAYTNNTMTVAPVLSATTTNAVSDTISIVFIPKTAGVSRAQGDATILINPTSSPVAGTSSEPSKIPPAHTGGGTQYSGPADLTVRIISQNSDGAGGATVSFDVANIGGSTSGSYYFTASLPTTQYYPYQSPQQPPLEPGSHVVNTLHFTGIASGGGMFAVTVMAGDVNQNNNYATTQIAAPYSSGQGYGATQYSGYNSYNTNTNYNSGTYTQYPVYPTY